MKKKSILKSLKSKFLKWHLYISLFFIPMAIFYKVTGIVGIFGYFGQQDSKVIEFNQSQLEFFKDFKANETKSTKEELNLARNKILEFLVSNHIELPYTNEINDSWDNKRYVLGGIAKYVEIDKNNPHSLILYKRDLLSNLMTLHFARGGILFNILAFCFVIFLFITYVTGLLICNFSKHRYKYGGVILIGFIITLVSGIVSAI
ncbi:MULTISPECIES: hypothetical protein [unclassified Helicobacter]|uniref:hypothetical protein n=1 Tax=unclassified Helicobacter TaxID=2593540 RepID=UPI000CF142B3|nr:MULTISPECIES: hypothetical protein [unclassified Helicobacter]